MKTLEELYYASDERSSGYDAARQAKVKEIAEYLEGVTNLSNTEEWAEMFMSNAESNGRIFQNEVSFEISGLQTKTGNPLPVTI